MAIHYALERWPGMWTLGNGNRGRDVDWVKLDSKVLASVAYDPEKQILNLRFRTGEVYRYFEFSGADYRAFLNAESRGKYFLANIRDQFRCERLAKLRVA